MTIIFFKKISSYLIFYKDFQKITKQCFMVHFDLDLEDRFCIQVNILQDNVCTLNCTLELTLPPSKPTFHIPCQVELFNFPLKCHSGCSFRPLFRLEGATKLFRAAVLAGVLAVKNEDEW